MEDIFSVQDDVTQKVVAELAVTLTAEENWRLARKHTQNFEAYDSYLLALKELIHLKKENFLRATELSRKVMELDPNFAGGYATLSQLLSTGVRFGFSTSPSEDLKKALELAQKAVSVDDTNWHSYHSLSIAYLMIRRHEDALAAMRSAERLHPGLSDVYIWLGFYLHWLGRGEEAVQAVKKAQELNPKYLISFHPGYLDFLGYAYFTAGQYEESITTWKKSIDHYGHLVVRLAYLAASYSQLGREEEAKQIAIELLKADPTFTVQSWELAHMYKNSQDTERLLNALRKAGLK